MQRIGPLRPGSVKFTDEKLRPWALPAYVPALPGAVVGCTRQLDQAEIAGTRVCPSIAKMELDCNTYDQAVAAVTGRFPDQREPTFSRGDRDNFFGWVQRMKQTIFPHKKIVEWTNSLPDMQALKSKKWNEGRFIHAFNKAILTDGFFEIECKVKTEPRAPEKAPRLLTLDSDIGQICALLCIKCIEDLLFHHFVNHCTKHVSKREAIARAMHIGHGRPCKMLEGDGKAFDITMTGPFRELTENMIMAHVTMVIKKLFPGLGVILQKHLEKNEEQEMVLRTKKKAKSLFQQIFGCCKISVAAIRRSGHRGTSVLNWLANHAMWSCMVFGRDAGVMCLQGSKTHKSRFGPVITIDYVFEGDDSIMAVSSELQDYAPQIQAKFHEWGINMKLAWRSNGDAANFIGWWMFVGEKGFTGVCMPDITKALKKTGYSTAPEMKQVLIRHGYDSQLYGDMSAAVLLARAHDFSGYSPSISRHYLMMAQSLTESALFNYETGMHTGCRDSAQVLAEIGRNNALANLSIEKEAEHITQCGFPVSVEDMNWFGTSYFHARMGDEEYTQAIPVGWR